MQELGEKNEMKRKKAPRIGCSRVDFRPRQAGVRLGFPPRLVVNLLVGLLVLLARLLELLDVATRGIRRVVLCRWGWRNCTFALVIRVVVLCSVQWLVCGYNMPDEGIIRSMKYYQTYQERA